MTVTDVVVAMLGDEPPIRIRAYDGSTAGPTDGPAALVINSPRALRWVLTAPGELGIARAYVSGDIDIEGDIFAALELRHLLPHIRVDRTQLAEMLRTIGPRGLIPLRPPPEETRLHGRRHSIERDSEAIRHHYDVSNTFYELLLGPSLTYSCAVWSSPDMTLEDAQAAKYELICRKLGLEPGMRLLDVGCGWGGMALHAARHHGARVVGVTISSAQVELATERVAAAGLTDLVEIRRQDYRHIHDGPFDAISSIGMFEHVGLDQLGTYFDALFALLEPGGRLLNHAIARPWQESGSTRFARRGFVDRYIFPDAELLEVGSVVTQMQHSGLEVRHVENLREHYALTLRAWSKNLEHHWAAAAAAVGERRCRVWRLYLAASAVNFEDGNLQIHQTLGTRTFAGRSNMPLRPRFEDPPRSNGNVTYDLTDASGTSGTAGTTSVDTAGATPAGTATADSSTSEAAAPQQRASAQL